jgi:CDP-diacylglycerol pyrophosphatase
MRLTLSQFVCSLASVVVLSSLAVPQTLAAQTSAQSSQHLVSPSDLRQSAVNATQVRQQNIEDLNHFFSSAQAQRALESAHMNPQEVKQAVAGLSDQELAQLASRTNKAQADFAAGNISDHDLLIILVCVAALILIIVAVH